MFEFSKKWMQPSVGCLGIDVLSPGRLSVSSFLVKLG